MSHLTAISGLGGKGPACFLLETEGKRLLFDFGEGPQPGLLPDIDAIGPVDALLLSHQHADHAGALRFLPRIGNPPVHASAYVARGLPVAAQSLPLRGTSDVCGITVTTGRSGHAPGGIWLHLALGGGFLYMGDSYVESLLYTYDSPPPAETMILDASYGDYEQPLASSEQALDELLAEHDKLLLPVPAQGRGPEIALYLLRRGVPMMLDDEMRQAVSGIADHCGDCIRPDAVADFKRMIDATKTDAANPKVILTSPATAKSELARRLIAARRPGDGLQIVFTGYTPPNTFAGDLLKNGHAKFMRWNVHPRLSDNVALVKAVGARRVVPAFGEATKARSAWERAFSPARTILDRSCEF